jgi:hypothetical protein
MTDLEPGGPYSPDRTIEAANTAAEKIRYLNVATLDDPHAAIISPQDLDRVIASLETLAQRMPQLLTQLVDWLTSEAEAGRLRVGYGRHEGKPGDAAMWARIEADRSAARFGSARESLAALHQITSAISRVADDEGEQD